MFNGVKNLLLVCAMAGVGAEEVRINGMRFGHVHVAFVNFWVVNVRGYKEDAAAYKLVIAAQAKAKADQDAADLATSARYSALAKESEHEHQISIASVQSAADRYAASHRVRPCAVAGGTSSPGPASLPDNSAPPDGTSGGTDWIAVAPEDYHKFTDATLQAAERGNFLQSLIDDGKAIPAPGFGD